MIAARAKKLVNNSTSATLQPTEHRSTARRNTGVSQSQRNYRINTHTHTPDNCVWNHIKPFSSISFGSRIEKHITIVSFVQFGLSIGVQTNGNNSEKDTIISHSAFVGQFTWNEPNTLEQCAPHDTTPRLHAHSQSTTTGAAADYTITSGSRAKNIAGKPRGRKCTRRCIGKFIHSFSACAKRKFEISVRLFQSPEDSDLSADIARLHLNRKISRDESDESEASSVCSERSFDSFRRNEVSLMLLNSCIGFD